MMRAIQFVKTGGVEVLALKEVKIPKPSEKQLLIKNKISGINFIDTYHRSGLYKVNLPYIPGREGSGVVEKVGTEIKDFKVGDRISYLGENTNAEFTLANPDYTIKLNKNETFENSAAVLLQGLTAMALTKLAYPVKAGDIVLVHASAGGTGSLIVQVCKALGATVIGVTSSVDKVKTSKINGCDHVINYNQEDILTKVREITNGKGVHCVFDGVGKTTFDISRQCLRRLGTLLSFGNASGKVDDIDIMKLVPNAIRLMRPTLYQFLNSKEDFQYLAKPLLNMVEKQQVKVNIHKIYPLEDIKQAHLDLESGNTQGKLLIKI
ncbi:NADPH:quinone reductase [Clydaea vesicula]|uniref:Probable quinone oxidoreductase n=1 Tax=Clydaea vesicula TaxID=447962 RepID=A0AAD5TXF2_9FUNG|nr:NADPH:quinone reductase [Clydaea vesicula]